jgi:hypothetical protein
MQIEKQVWENEQPIGSQFLSDVNFSIGKQTCVGASKVRKKGANQGKTLLRFNHEQGVLFSIGLGDYRIVCERAGVSGCDSNGNILDVVSEKPIDGQYVISS